MHNKATDTPIGVRENKKDMKKTRLETLPGFPARA